MKTQSPPTLAEGLRTLAYLDLTALKNRFTQLLHAPRRALPWLIFIAWMGFVVWTRLEGAGSQRMPWREIGPILGTLIPGAYLVILGLMVHGSVRRAPAALASGADARFLLGSPLPPRLVVFWLQLRQAAALLKSAAVNIVIWSALFAATPGVTASGIAKGGLALLLAFILAFGLRLPAFVLARRRPNLVSALGVLITLGGAAALLLEVYGALTSAVSPLGPAAWRGIALPLGSTVAAAMAGSGWALLWLFLLATGATLLTARLGDDCYPEIYLSSARLFRLRDARRSGRRAAPARLRDLEPERGGRRPVDIISSPGQSVPQGALTLLWKEWLGLRRGRGGLRAALLFLLLAAALGAIAGRFALSAGSFSLGVIAGMAIYPAIILSTMAGLRLVEDLRRPIWWLSDASLTGRLAAWSFATSLRGAVLIAVGLLAAGMSARSAETIWMLPATFTGLWLLRAVALAVYTLLPTMRDMRGPGNLLRLLLTLVLLTPVTGLGVLAGLALGSLPAGLLTGAIAALPAIWGLLAFGAARLRGNGMSVARAEQS